MKTVVTHGGKAHRDEFLSIGLLLHAAIIDPGTPIYRREPTSDELADPNVIVLDVGGDYDVELNNWDHHQMENSLVCTLSLLADHCVIPKIGDITYSDLFEEFAWYEVTVAMDALGSAGLSRVTKHERFPEEFKSPVEASILDMMSREPQVSTFVKDVAYETINLQVQASTKLVRRLKELKDADFWSEGGIHVIQFDGDSFGIPQYRRKYEPHLNVAITRNNRVDTEGWALYRYNKGCVDFSLLKDDPRVLFIHPEGYLATTDKKYGRSELRDLLTKASTKEKRNG
jgi:hypothetical protein